MNKSAPTQKQRRERYTPHQQQMNALAGAVCGIKPITEADWLAADIKAKAERLERDRAVLLRQINWLTKTEQL